MKNICQKCNQFKDLALFKGQLFCANCLAEIAIDQDVLIKNSGNKKSVIEEELKKEAEFIMINKGFTTQILKTTEELAELQKELMQWLIEGLIADNLKYEIADVENMLYQLKLFLELKDSDIFKLRQEKNKREICRIEANLDN